MKRLLALICLISLLLSGCSVEFVGLSPTDPPASPPQGLLTVHYLDVGQADCALVEYEDFTMLIDGGNVEDGRMVISYLQQQGIEELDCVISTHPHEDHVGGLAAVLAVFPTKQVLSPTTTYASDCFDDFLHYADQQGLTVQIPQPGDRITHGDLVGTVMGPVGSYPETNNSSIVLKLDFGQTSFLFTGDMETIAENGMLDYWEDRTDWDVDVLKAGHHGSSTSSGYRLIYETAPEYTIISCGKDNSYGHPDEEVVSRFLDAGTSVFRTDELGTIMVVSDGAEITVTWEHGENTPQNIPSAESRYIGNKSSGKFHTSTCASLPKEDNRVYFDSYEAAIKAGFTPCGSCLG